MSAHPHVEKGMGQLSWSFVGLQIDLRFPGQWYQAESGLHQNWMRDYDPTTGRYIEPDPLGLVDGASVYVYVRQNPQNEIDPRGLKGWRCSRPFGKPPGEAGPVLLNHQYLCVTKPDGTVRCGSITTDGNYFRSTPRMTRPDEDYYHEASCEQVDDDEDRRYEKCVEDSFNAPIPRKYGIGWQGLDCQEYSADIHNRCKRKCMR